MTEPVVEAARGVAVTLSGVGRTFPGGVKAVERIDLHIPAGKFVA